MHSTNVTANSMVLRQSGAAHPVFVRAQQEIDSLVAAVQSVSVDDDRATAYSAPELEELIERSCYGADDGELVCVPNTSIDRALMDSLNKGVRRMGQSLATMRTSPIYIGLPDDFYWGQLRVHSTEADYAHRVPASEGRRAPVFRRTRFIIHCVMCQFRSQQPNLT